jgi:hypothetical protein
MWQQQYQQQQLPAPQTVVGGCSHAHNEIKDVVSHNNRTATAHAQSAFKDVVAYNNSNGNSFSSITNCFGRLLPCPQ